VAFRIACGEAKHEGSVFSTKDLREVQDRAAPWRGAGDLRESQAQAAARMSIETRNWKIENSEHSGKLDSRRHSDFQVSIFKFRLWWR
jgi:hypothetical protein